MLGKMWYMISLIIFVTLIVMVSGCSFDSKNMTSAEVKSKAVNVSGESLVNNSEKLVDKPISITGKVFDKTSYDNGTSVLLISTSDSHWWGDTYVDYHIYVYVMGELPQVHLSDNITVYGVYNGYTQYKSIGGVSQAPVVTAWPENIVK